MKKWYFLSPLALQKLIWIPTRLLLIFCGHIKIRGLENLKGIGSNVIFAANHSSEMDVFLIPASLPFFSRFSPIFYTSRERSFYKLAGWRQRFYGGAFFKAWGAYPVQVGLNDYEKSLAGHISIVKDGGSILVFPEGGTTKDGQFKPAKGGIAYLSYATKRPIVPVRFDGTFRLSPAEFFSGRRKLSISFGAPVYDAAQLTAAPAPDRCKAEAGAIMERIRLLGGSGQPSGSLRTALAPQPLPPDSIEKAP